MPNSRKVGKRQLGVWMDEEVKRLVMEKARREHKSMSDVIREIIRRELKDANTTGGAGRRGF